MSELWDKSIQDLSKLRVPKLKYANSCPTSSSLGRKWQLLTEFLQAKVIRIRTHTIGTSAMYEAYSIREMKVGKTRGEDF